MSTHATAHATGPILCGKGGACERMMQCGVSESVGQWVSSGQQQRLGTTWCTNILSAAAAPKRVCGGGVLDACVLRPTHRPTGPPIHRPTGTPTDRPTWPWSQTAVRIERGLNVVDGAAGWRMVEHVVRVEPYQKHGPDGHADHAEHRHHPNEPPRSAAQRLGARRHGTERTLGGSWGDDRPRMRTVEPAVHAGKDRHRVCGSARMDNPTRPRHRGRREVVAWVW